MRIQYAELLANVMLSHDHDLIFFDESSFHGWMGKVSHIHNCVLDCLMSVDSLM